MSGYIGVQMGFFEVFGGVKGCRRDNGVFGA